MIYEYVCDLDNLPWFLTCHAVRDCAGCAEICEHVSYVYVAVVRIAVAGTYCRAW